MRGNVLGLNLSTRASMVFLADVAHACRVRRDEIDLVLQGFSTKMTPYEADALSDALKVERERGWGDVALGRVEVRADPTDLDRAYCAGLIDGSSHVFSFVEKPGTPPSYGARVTIQPSRPEGVLTMQGFYGGTTYAAREKDRTNSYMIFRRQEVLRLFDDVLPFLLDRREDAQLAVERLRESRRRKVADAAVVEVASESMNEAHP
jgi:hypothetical protein